MKTLPDTPPPYGTIVFDCDSTLSRIEGIEELARDCRREVEALTARAMNGELPLEAAYGARLDLIRPTRGAVADVAGLYSAAALPHAAELVAALHALGKSVRVVSGGLLPAVQPFAVRLGITAPERVEAVDIRFDPEGQYAGFDDASPLAKSGGKIEVLQRIARAPGAGPVAFIGDGATDLEAAGECARFIAYGGVVRRELVFESARVTCESSDFAALLPLLTTEEERRSLAGSGAHEALLLAATLQQP